MCKLERDSFFSSNRTFFAAVEQQDKSRCLEILKWNSLGRKGTGMHQRTTDHVLFEQFLNY
jgi:hypothetical protein